MLIGLTGAAGSGKDTVYEVLAELYERELPVERRSFADALYESAAAALGVSPANLRAWKRHEDARITVQSPGGFVEAVLTVRQYLQRYGTEAHREVFGEGFWTGAVDLTDHRGVIVAVTDVRFLNEAEAVRRAGGFMARVIGPGEVPGDHASERPLPDELMDVVIHNVVRDDDRAHLRRQVRGMVTRFRRLRGEMP